MIRKIRKDNRRAQGHVEMIISFVIFIGFVSVLLFSLNPLTDKRINFTLLEITESKLMENWTISYFVGSLSFDNPPSVSTGCIEISNLIGLNNNILVQDKDGKFGFGEINGGNIKINKSGTNGRFYKIYSSDNFKQTDLSACSSSPISEADYEFGPVNSYSNVLYENLILFIDKYNQDYESLKQEIGLQNDFAVFVYTQNSGSRELIANASIFVPKTNEIIARDIPVLAINKTAGKTDLLVNIRVW